MWGSRKGGSGVNGIDGESGSPSWSCCTAVPKYELLELGSGGGDRICCSVFDPESGGDSGDCLAGRDKGGCRRIGAVHGAVG